MAAILAANDVGQMEFNGGKITYRLNTTFKPAKDIMLFATASTGYKSGGFDSGFGRALGDARVFDPETVNNYELGVKTQVLDRAVTFNATAFRMDVKQFQLRSYDGTGFSVRNAGSIRQQGGEAELGLRPTRDFTVTASINYLDSKFTDFRDAPGLPAFGGIQDSTGKRVAFSPEWQGVISADYHRDVGSDFHIGLNGSLSFTSDTDVGGAGDNNPQTIQDGYSIIALRALVGNERQGWEASIGVENLTDKRVCSIIYSQVLGSVMGLNNPATGGTAQRCILNEPRSIRAALKWTI